MMAMNRPAAARNSSPVQTAQAVAPAAVPPAAPVQQLPHTASDLPLLSLLGLGSLGAGWGLEAMRRRHLRSH